MHPNPLFHGDPGPALEAAVARGFGLLTVSTEGAPIVAALPFERLTIDTVRVTDKNGQNKSIEDRQAVARARQSSS
ncbi:MAG: hypothetical protein KC656_16465 [Myxococcales bacterium]|nr:hypothetical protein [Myxococcales bacterium]MCA9569444.1 hypothetical protein [Myxococcales bacterium]MCB9693167.1 hypothetical protein [Alphaproteobacteria bacterium]